MVHSKSSGDYRFQIIVKVNDSGEFQLIRNASASCLFPNNRRKMKILFSKLYGQKNNRLKEKPPWQIYVHQFYCETDWVLFNRTLHNFHHTQNISCQLRPKARALGDLRTRLLPICLQLTTIVYVVTLHFVMNASRRLSLKCGILN